MIVTPTMFVGKPADVDLLQVPVTFVANAADAVRLINAGRTVMVPDLPTAADVLALLGCDEHWIANRMAMARSRGLAEVDVEP
jgi:hypothetical protein